MIHLMPFTIRYCSTNSTIITYDYLHNDEFYHSLKADSAQCHVKLNAA